MIVFLLYILPYTVLITFLSSFLIIQLPLVESERRIRSGVPPELNGISKDTDDLDGEETSNRSRRSEKKSSPMMTADGAYASQSSFSMTKKMNNQSCLLKDNPLRHHLLEGNFFLGACICAAVAKAGCRLISGKRLDDRRDDSSSSKSIEQQQQQMIRATVARALLIIASCLTLANSDLPEKAATVDDRLRMNLCLKVLLLAQQVSALLDMELHEIIRRNQVSCIFSFV